MAVIRYGSETFFVSAEDFQQLAPDLDDSMFAVALRSTIRRLLGEGEHFFLPLPIRSDEGSRVDLLISPGVPIAVYTDDDLEATTNDLGAVFKRVLNNNDGHEDSSD